MAYGIHQYELTIKEFHLDTFGHVNNATYLQLYEEARWQFITERGYGLDKIKSSGLGPRDTGNTTALFKRTAPEKNHHYTFTNG